MRGIGKGQKVVFLIPPEVAKLIKMELGVGPGPTPDEHADLRSGYDEQDLADVVAWLLLNGVKSERIQANMLVCQNIASVWKKRAYRQLMKLEDKALLRVSEQGGQPLRQLMAWKEETDNVVPNSIPLSSNLREFINKRISDMKHAGLLDDEGDQRVLDEILKKEFVEGKQTSSKVSDTPEGEIRDENILLEGEQVQEQEQEQVPPIWVLST